MADSDGEYVGDLSDDDLNALPAGADTSSYGTRSKDRKRTRDGKPKGNNRTATTWETFSRSWETVQQGVDGTISIAELLEAEKRRRLLRDTTPVQRGIIRHLMLVLDMSSAMAEKDLLPNRYTLTLNYAVEFVRSYFAQNPISQLGIVGMRDGLAVRISDLGGNPEEHIERLVRFRDDFDPQGNASLQNALDMCHGALFGVPSHATREVLIIYGALVSIDPRDINDTITSLVKDRVRVSIVGLSAQIAICEKLCSRTNNDDGGSYSVALDEKHFHELFLAATTPPVTTSTEHDNASLLMMGFPSLEVKPKGTMSLCACHHKPRREGYNCTRCGTKVCQLPAQCPVCGLTLIQSTHLARSYHHLFPLRNWVEVPWTEATKSACCYSCLAPFLPVPKEKLKGKTKETPASSSSTFLTVPTATAPVPSAVVLAKPKGVSESGRYACQVCKNHFCIDCDVFAHEIVHNCPGCQSDIREPAEVNGSAGHTNGGGGAGGGDPMVID